MIELIATDIDGTLLQSHVEGRHGDHVSERTLAALRAASDAGLLVAFVTGRPPRWLDPIADLTGHVGVAVGANGAVLYDLTNGEIITIHTLDVPVMRELAQKIRSVFPGVTFALEFGLGFAAEPAYVHDWDINPKLDRNGLRIPPPTIGTFDEIVTAPAVKLLVKDRTADPDAFLAAATDLVGDRATLTHSSSFGLLELSAPGVTKATGLAELAASHGFTADQVAAIGDMPNDLPMLAWAGRSYAVANAHPDVLDIADEITVSNDDDAVAILIESVLADRAAATPGRLGT